MKLSSLPLKMSVSYRNRTYNRVLGGPRYIHLTKGTNAVFSGFSAFLAPAAMFMNPIHLRDELPLLLYIDFSLFANSKIQLCLTKWSALSCPLGGGCYIHFTKETYICCIQTFLYTAYLFYHIIR